MSYNRIAVYGHRGWASSAIVSALISSGAPVKVLHRASSDTTNLPSSTPKVSVDVDDQQAVIDALQDVDIMISLVGHEGIQKQHAFVKAIPSTSVKLFVPSDMGHRPDSLGLRIPVYKAKSEVEEAAKQAGIPTTVVRPGYLVESSLGFPIMGVDYPGNRIVFTGDSQHQQMSMCTRKYVAAAYAAIFARTPLAELQNRAIGLSELSVTGDEIAKAMGRKYGTAPQVFTHTLEKVDREIEACLQKETPLAGIWYYRKVWGTGQLAHLVGPDIWDVEGYPKTNIEELLVEGKMEAYRPLPQPVVDTLNGTIH